jgi:hypothetical protein
MEQFGTPSVELGTPMMEFVTPKPSFFWEQLSV